MNEQNKIFYLHPIMIRITRITRRKTAVLCLQDSLLQVIQNCKSVITSAYLGAQAQKLKPVKKAK